MVGFAAKEKKDRDPYFIRRTSMALLIALLSWFSLLVGWGTYMVHSTFNSSWFNVLKAIGRNDLAYKARMGVFDWLLGHDCQGAKFLHIDCFHSERMYRMGFLAKMVKRIHWDVSSWSCADVSIRILPVLNGVWTGLHDEVNTLIQIDIFNASQWSDDGSTVWTGLGYSFKGAKLWNWDCNWRIILGILDLVFSIDNRVDSPRTSKCYPSKVISSSYWLAHLLQHK